MAKGYIGNASSKAYPLSKGWVGNGSNKAYPLKAGWMGDANGKARKVFGAAGYIWQKYAVTTTGQIYQEVAGESTTANVIYPFNELYVGSTYTLDSNTGQFTVNQSTEIAFSSSGANNAVGKYYIETNTSGTVSGSTVNLITAATYSRYDLKLTITPYTAELTTIQAKGDLLGTVTAEDITAYPINGVADDGYWYVLQNEIAQIEIVYSGTYVDELVSMQAGDYRLLTLTGSGMLTLSQAVTADIWICGGGSAGGASRSSESNIPGGGGGYFSSDSMESLQNVTITLGAGGTISNSISTRSGGASTVSGDLSLSVEATPTNGDGASGGGGTVNGSTSIGIGTPGTGGGVSTIPFFDSSIFTPLCNGGGGGGSYAYKSGSTGGTGGENGGNGEAGVANGTNAGGSGGAGAGNGARGSVSSGSAGYSGLTPGGAATNYGCGGGAGGSGVYDDSDGTTLDAQAQGGAGYQGVCFIRIPLN